MLWGVAYHLLLVLLGGVLNGSEIFGMVNSSVINCPLAFLILRIDFNEPSVPLDLIGVVVTAALHRSGDDSVYGDNRYDDPDLPSLKIFRGPSEERTQFIHPVTQS